MEGLFDDKEAWQRLINDAEVNRPSKGKTVVVLEGKRAGTIGQVFWHGRDKFSDAWKYDGPAAWHLRDVNGRYGWRVGVKTQEGDKFFVNADNVNVIHEPEDPPGHEDEHCEPPTPADLVDTTPPDAVPYTGEIPDYWMGPDEERQHELAMDAWACRVEANTPPEYR